MTVAREREHPQEGDHGFRGRHLGEIRLDPRHGAVEDLGRDLPVGVRVNRADALDEVVKIFTPLSGG